MPRTPNTQLQLLLTAAAWRPAQLALAVRKVAAERGLDLPCHHTTVRRWLDGTQPRPPFPELVLESFSRCLGRRVTVQEAGFTRAPAVLVDPSWEADPVRKLAQLTHAELDPQRRALLGAGVFTLTALALPDLPAPAGPILRAGHARVDEMRSMTSLFATAADQHGGQHVRAALSAYVAHDVLPRLHGPARDHARPDLLSAAAQLTLLLGGMCADGGQDAAAQHYHQIAARLAADGGDHLTLAIALRTMATHAHDLGHRTTAVLGLTEQADRHARHAPPGVRAYTKIQLAVLQAHHDRRAALASLALAEQLHARAESAPGPFSTYPAGALHYQCAQVLAALGDHAGAVGSLASSLRLRGPSERLPAALTTARLAEAQLRLGHLEQALHHWRFFLDAYPAVRSARAVQRLHAARRCLRPHQRHRGAAAVLDRIRDLTGTPA
ncbi:hypothetical protein ACQEWB_27670 [Streptomyces sp. CA-249302]|uniref:hypothetical protein n=1 Tax=Streptomyces sp. CA-249302 TaxID=3240058 RepID=UPI003D8BB229